MRLNLTIARKHTVCVLYNDHYSSEIHERIENSSSRGGSRHFQKGAPFIKGKKIGFQNDLFFFFGKIKDTESSFKITKHGKKKNSKGESGNILLKHVFISL